MYKYKYEKYKTKVDNLYKNMGLMGGAITRNDALKKILSIGFEFETSKIIPVIIDNQHQTVDTLTTSTASTAPTEKTIILKSDNNFSFEMVQDYGKSSSNLGKTIDVHNIGNLKYFARSEKFGDKKYEILFEKDKIYATDETHRSRLFSHAEFIITYKSISISDNIIWEKFIDACTEIYEHLNSFNSAHSTDLVIIKHNVMDSSENVIEAVKLFTPTTYLNEGKSLCYINDKFETSDPDGFGNVRFNEYIDTTDSSDIMNNIDFLPQVTIGIHLNSIIDVVSHLLQNSDGGDSKSTEFNGCVEKAKNLVRNFIIASELPIYDDECNNLQNWLSIVLYNAINYDAYTAHTTSFPEDVIYFKDFCPINLRHPYYKICPLNRYAHEFKRYIASKLNTSNSDDIKVLYYILNLSEGIEKFGDGNAIETYSTHYDYNPETKIILIEFRRFHRFIKDEINQLRNAEMKTLSIKTMKKFIDTNGANCRINFGKLTGNKRKKDVSDDDDFGNESDDGNFSNSKADNSKGMRRIIPDDSDDDY